MSTNGTNSTNSANGPLSAIGARMLWVRGISWHEVGCLLNDPRDYLVNQLGIKDYSKRKAKVLIEFEYATDDQNDNCDFDVVLQGVTGTDTLTATILRVPQSQGAIPALPPAPTGMPDELRLVESGNIAYAHFHLDGSKLDAAARALTYLQSPSALPAALNARGLPLRLQTLQGDPRDFAGSAVVSGELTRFTYEWELDCQTCYKCAGLYRKDGDQYQVSLNWALWSLYCNGPG